MAKGTINKVIIIGRLGADPEVRYMPNGNAVANIRVATDESWKDRNTGESQEHTEWHNIVCYNKLGEIVGQYLRKGSKAYFEGRIQTRKWQDQSGQDRYKTEIIASDMQMLDSRGSGGSSEFNSSAGQSTRSLPSNSDGGYSREQPKPDFSPSYNSQPTRSSLPPDFNNDYQHLARPVTPAAVDTTKHHEHAQPQTAEEDLNDIIPF